MAHWAASPRALAHWAAGFVVWRTGPLLALALWRTGPQALALWDTGPHALALWRTGPQALALGHTGPQALALWGRSQSNQEKRTDANIKPFAVGFVSQNPCICRITFKPAPKDAGSLSDPKTATASTIFCTASHQESSRAQIINYQRNKISSIFISPRGQYAAQHHTNSSHYITLPLWYYVS